MLNLFGLKRKRDEEPKMDEAQELEEALASVAEMVQKEQDERICHTTGFHYNCALHVLTHHMVAHIDEIIDYLEDDRFGAPYLALLETFREYYELPETFTWEHIKELVTNNPVPTDLEAIFGPALRKHLGKFLAQQDLWDELYTMAFSDFLTTGNLLDNATPMFNANEEKFTELKDEFDLELTTLDMDADDYFALKNALQDRILAKAKAYWITEGNQRYAEYMSDSDIGEFVAYQQFMNFAQYFFIRAKIIAGGYDSPLEQLGGECLWNLTAHNPHGIHYEYEGTPEEALAHNKYYPDDTDKKFKRDKTLSGEFKLWQSGKEGPKGVDKKVIKYVQNFAKSVLEEEVDTKPESKRRRRR